MIYSGIVSYFPDLGPVNMVALVQDELPFEHHSPGQTSESTHLQYRQWSTGIVSQKEQERRIVSKPIAKKETGKKMG
jgi:hypothetical protein